MSGTVTRNIPLQFISCFYGDNQGICPAVCPMNSLMLQFVTQSKAKDTNSQQQAATSQQQPTTNSQQQRLFPPLSNAQDVGSDTSVAALDKLQAAGTTYQESTTALNVAMVAYAHAIQGGSLAGSCTEAAEEELATAAEQYKKAYVAQRMSEVAWLDAFIALWTEHYISVECSGTVSGTQSERQTCACL